MINLHCQVYTPLEVAKELRHGSESILLDDVESRIKLANWLEELNRCRAGIASAECALHSVGLFGRTTQPSIKYG